MYIRFKKIPLDEISGVYDGDLGKIRDELGVSCYKAVKTNETYQIILPSLDDGCLYDLLHFIQDSKNGEIPIYLIDGDEVGIGTYGEPVLKNITIIKELKIVEFVDPKPKFKMDNTNPQFVELSSS